MTPLAPLRIFFTGLLGLVGLGLGIYCIWRYADEVRRSDTVVVAEVPFGPNEQLDDELRMQTPNADISRPADKENTSVVKIIRPQVHPWAFLTAGLLLTSLSLVGRWPLMWLARLFSAKAYGPMKPTRESGTTINRPDGTCLNVEVCGNVDGPMIVFTHGWSLDLTAWHYAKTMLSDRYRLVFWDLPGLGRSKAPDDGNFEIAKMADDLHAVVSSIGNSKRIYLAGHSIGGMITQIYGGKYNDHLREHVAGIVLIHTTYTNPLHTMLGGSVWTAIEKIVIMPSQYVMIALAPLAWLSNWQSYFNGSMQLTSRLTSFTGKQSFQQLDYASWLSTKAWPGVIARGNLAMFQYDAQSALPMIDVPMLVIGGKHDRVTEPVASDRINELAVGSESLRNSGGHLAIFEFHEQVMAGITKFVEEHNVV